MRQTNKDFKALYNKHNTILEPGSDDVDPMGTYQNVLQKAGLAPSKHIRKYAPRRILLIAAALATAVLTIAAAMYSVSDAFRGILSVHHSAKGTSSADPILDRTGLLLSQTQKSDTVDLSLRAVAGDERSLKILVDVVDNSGKGLAIMQPDGTISDRPFSLRRYDITKANGDFLAGSSKYSFINIDPSKNKLTILFDYAIMGDTIRNQTLKLHFEDILQEAELDGAALSMETDALYEIVSRFGQYSDSDFQLSSVAPQKSYLLHVTNSNNGYLLSKDYPGIKIIAATVKDGSLYLQGTADPSSPIDKVLDNVVLYNNSGSTLEASETGRFDDTTWAVRFDHLGSLNALKGYVWHYGAGESFHTAYKGSWEFTFKADFQDLTIKLAPNLSTTWEGHNLTVTALEISPYSLFLQYSTDKDTALRMFPPTEWGAMQTSDWIESYHPITLTLKDGTSIQVDGGSLAPKGGTLAAVPENAIGTEYEMQYDIKDVIDPEQLASIKIGNQVIPLKE